MKSNIRTYQTRIHSDIFIDQVLNQYAKLFAETEHLLFKAIILGVDPNICKISFLSALDITARQFNACRIVLDGKIASVKERRDTQIIELQEQIKTLDTKVKKIKNLAVAHQKRRRLGQLNCKLAALKKDKEKGAVRLCFGSKKLFRAQFSLKENGFTTHDEWKQAWNAARYSEFFVLGSKDETSGNQSCTAYLNADGSLSLRLRLPYNLEARHGKYIFIPNVRFEYGHKQVVDTLLECKKRRELKDTHFGQALSYRFKKDKKGWRVFVSVNLPNVPIITDPKFGVIGVDINNNHLAVVETDRFGNPIRKESIPLSLYGKSSHQAKAIIGNACKNIVQTAQITKKPVVVEELNFQKKKASLKEKHASYSRMLSSFAYSSIITHVKSRSAKFGVEVREVNPAYTSVIGRVKFSKRYGLSIHHAAALSIARRSLRFSEKLPTSLSNIPDGKSGHVALSLPVRNRNEHVWTLWRKVSKKLSVVLAAHFRSTNYRSTSTCKSTCETPEAPDVVGEIPTHESSEQLFC
ncbi:MAG: IS200/IS605 family accessory protein TnpB-related protein [Chlamydiales bacterium]|nr:IS200/IS605 family accessory protein TnpB-related protein [Chlamydiales bacterium]